MIESKTFPILESLIAQGDVLISSHGYDELADDDIMVRDVLHSISEAIVLEDYPEFGKGPAVLLLQMDTKEIPIHTVWGIPRGQKRPAVLITAYRPDPQRWSDDLMRRL